jgi:hypothetical protein
MFFGLPKNGQKISLLPRETLFAHFGQTKKYFSYPNGT